MADEAQYFSTDPSIGEDNGNLNSSNLINSSTDSSGNYSSEFNGFAELISPKSIKEECQTECAFTPSENYASYTDISYNTKPCSRLSTEINEAFIKHETGIDMDSSQGISNHYEKSTDENLPQHLPHTENIKQETDNVHSSDEPNYTKVNHEPVGFQPETTISEYQKFNIVENVIYPPLKSTNCQPEAQKHLENVQKVNGNAESAKSDRLTSSLRLIRKPNYRQSLLLMKTKKMSIRLDRSIVEDFLQSQQKKMSVRLLQPVVVLKRLEPDDEDNSVKRSKARRIGKRKQNRAIWDGETVKDKRMFKRRRDDTDDAEGSSGFTGGSSGSCYSSDSQSGRSSTRDSVDSPPPKSTNGGANDSTEHNCKLVSCKHFINIYLCNHFNNNF